MKNTLLIFGYGYTGSNVERIMSQNGWRVLGTSRSPSTSPLIIPYEKATITEAMKQATHILISIPPNEAGDIVLTDFSDILSLSKTLKWIGYLSSTSVYGDHKGALVNEESILYPSNTRAKQRIIAEDQWLAFGKKHKINVNIFRLAGIYGPERNAIYQVSKGVAKSIFKEGQVFSRIHVEDIARIIFAAIQINDKAQIYNLADDEPCPTFKVNNFAAELLGVDPPPIIDIKEAVLSEMGKEFYNDNKRVSNAKIKEVLHVKLKYPTFREGLLAIYNNYN